MNYINTITHKEAGNDENKNSLEDFKEEITKRIEEELEGEEEEEAECEDIETNAKRFCIIPEEIYWDPIPE